MDDPPAPRGRLHAGGGVTDRYATALAAALYRELVRDETQPVARALAQAHYTAQVQLAREHRDDPVGLPPEYAVATLLCAGDDAPLRRPRPTGRTPHGGDVGAVRGVGAGTADRPPHRTPPPLRAAMGILRRTRAAVDECEATGGLVLTGIGGIGKTALAGRIIARARDDGWLVAVHEGRWNPAALFTAVAEALTGGGCLPGSAGSTRSPGCWATGDCC